LGESYRIIAIRILAAYRTEFSYREQEREPGRNYRYDKPFPDLDSTEKLGMAGKSELKYDHIAGN
jgi:hypothetical protein